MHNKEDSPSKVLKENADDIVSNIGGYVLVIKRYRSPDSSAIK